MGWGEPIMEVYIFIVRVRLNSSNVALFMIGRKQIAAGSHFNVTVSFHRLYIFCTKPHPLNCSSIESLRIGHFESFSLHPEDIMKSPLCDILIILANKEV